MQAAWQSLIASYFDSRKNLKCVVVIVDLRHELKILDLQLVERFRSRELPFLLVYTKADKLSANEREKNSVILDAGFGVTRSNRVLFSAKTGMGRDSLIQELDRFLV